MGKVRLDRLLTDRGLAPSRERARALIMAGRVLVNETPANKAGILVAVDAPLRITGEEEPYVSRGGHKLKAALEHFGLAVMGMAALDVGASTGGFTDCLLKEGVRRVYALDVGYGQLAWPLRQDPRVVVIERTNIRRYDGRHLDETIDLVVVDVSFISLKLVLPAVYPFLRDGGVILALVKPQFEVGREHVGKGGVVRDRALQESALAETVRFCGTMGLSVKGTCPSPLRGPAGNREFFILAEKTGADHGD